MVVYTMLKSCSIFYYNLKINTLVYYKSDIIKQDKGEIDIVPSSVPSMIDTLSGLQKNKDSLNTSLTCSRNILGLCGKTWSGNTGNTREQAGQEMPEDTALISTT